MAGKIISIECTECDFTRQVDTGTVTESPADIVISHGTVYGHTLNVTSIDPEENGQS